jgi:hypothetical protein
LGPEEFVAAQAVLEIPFTLNWRTPPSVVRPLPDVSLEWGAVREYAVTQGVFASNQPAVSLSYDVVLLQVSH